MKNTKGRMPMGAIVAYDGGPSEESMICASQNREENGIGSDTAYRI